MSDATPFPSIRKRLMTSDSADLSRAPGQIDIASRATLSYSSEDRSYPLENMLDGRGGKGGASWKSARPNMTEQIVIEFDSPQSISRVMFEVEETRLERTQEIRMEVSFDGGHSYTHFIMQQYTFSPRGATFQHEDLRVDVKDATHIRITIMPNKSGHGRASLASLVLYE
jgi:hypothetical protein